MLYYSNAILAPTLPERAPYISLAITVVNVLMTLPLMFLIEVRPPAPSVHPRLLTLYSNPRARRRRSAAGACSRSPLAARCSRSLPSAWASARGSARLRVLRP